jgi:hypothetical protein
MPQRAAWFAFLFVDSTAAPAILLSGFAVPGSDGTLVEFLR